MLLITGIKLLEFLFINFWVASKFVEATLCFWIGLSRTLQATFIRFNQFDDNVPFAVNFDATAIDKLETDQIAGEALWVGTIIRIQFQSVRMQVIELCHR